MGHGHAVVSDIGTDDEPTAQQQQSQDSSLHPLSCTKPSKTNSSNGRQEKQQLYIELHKVVPGHGRISDVEVPPALPLPLASVVSIPTSDGAAPAVHAVDEAAAPALSLNDTQTQSQSSYALLAALKDSYAHMHPRHSVLTRGALLSRDFS
jgi:hypothetical protein